MPHIIRLWVGSDYRILLLASFLSGSIFLVLSDLLARTVIAPNRTSYRSHYRHRGRDHVHSAPWLAHPRNPDFCNDERVLRITDLS